MGAFLTENFIKPEISGKLYTLSCIYPQIAVDKSKIIHSSLHTPAGFFYPINFGGPRFNIRNFFVLSFVFC